MWGWQEDTSGCNTKENTRPNIVPQSTMVRKAATESPSWQNKNPARSTKTNEPLHQGLHAFLLSAARGARGVYTWDTLGFITPMTQFRPMQCSLKAIRASLVHATWSDWNWMKLLMGERRERLSCEWKSFHVSSSLGVNTTKQFTEAWKQ